MKAADVLVLPNSGKDTVSRLYTSPMKLAEYMASGTPIVASDLPSLREALDESNSVLCAPDDPSALAGALMKLLSDAELSRKVSAKALSDVKGRTWEKRAQAIAGLIDRTAPHAAMA